MDTSLAVFFAALFILAFTLQIKAILPAVALLRFHASVRLPLNYLLLAIGVLTAVVSAGFALVFGAIALNNHWQVRIEAMRVVTAWLGWPATVVLALTLFCDSAAGQQPLVSTPGKTRIVLLGTGTPGPLPDRSGPATAVVVNDVAYLVDFGPGVVRRANAAFLDRDVKALEPTKLRVAFVTHLHSDHTVGYPDLIFTPWTIGRRTPLEVYGPKGLNAMTEHILEAYRVDIETRTNPEGNQRTFPQGHGVNAHEIGPGIVYKDANVTVTAFATEHAMESYGYRFDTPDRSIVISGDTNPTRATIDACSGCDVLIHEAHSPAWLATRPDYFQEFAAKFHTTTTELAALAVKAKPRLLILYHYVSVSPEDLHDEMFARYGGHFVVGRDLDVY